VVVGGGGDDDFDELLTKPGVGEKTGRASDTRCQPTRPGRHNPADLRLPNDGQPKGVMHSANTLMANIVSYAERLNLWKG
jgi:cyclohexanecarboxylate-CoA ligase